MNPVHPLDKPISNVPLPASFRKRLSQGLRHQPQSGQFLADSVMKFLADVLLPPRRDFQEFGFQALAHRDVKADANVAKRLTVVIVMKMPEGLDPNDLLVIRE